MLESCGKLMRLAVNPDAPADFLFMRKTLGASNP